MITLKKIQIVDQKPRNVKFVGKLETIEEISENMLKTFISRAHLSIIASFVVKVLMLRTTCISIFQKPIETSRNKYLYNDLVSTFFRLLSPSYSNSCSGYCQVMKKLHSAPLKSCCSFVGNQHKKFLGFTVISALFVRKSFLGNLLLGIMWSQFISLGCLNIHATSV